MDAKRLGGSLGLGVGDIFDTRHEAIQTECLLIPEAPSAR